MLIVLNRVCVIANKIFENRTNNKNLKWQFSSFKYVCLTARALTMFRLVLKNQVLHGRTHFKLSTNTHMCAYNTFYIRFQASGTRAYFSFSQMLSNFLVLKFFNKQAVCRVFSFVGLFDFGKPNMFNCTMSVHSAKRNRRSNSEHLKPWSDVQGASLVFGFWSYYNCP